ncbi:MAG: Subtilisin-like peptidase [Thermoleophilia bacterium]|nr:Subtilisin-like peptidase [Thermoleophilia bacterium]
MLRPHRRRLLRSALGFALLACIVVLGAQLAGVAGNRSSSPSRLVFEGVHERWMVKAPGKSGAALESAARSLGGGKSSSELPGDWYEVKLGDEVAAADAEAAFGKVGATDVEPVLPRLPYDEPNAFEDPAPAPTTTTRAGTEPGSHDDPPGALGQGSSLREGPMTATRLGEQWALSQPSDQDVDGLEAWQVGTGVGAIVAVIDTGVDATHPDLAGRVLEGKDFSGAGTGANVDRVGHGTNVASIIAANGATMAGIAPDARILPLKVFRDSAGGFSMAGYVSAIRYAADNGADVINISLGCGGTTSCFSQAELDALTYATDKGVVIVAAAGNGDRTGNGMDNDGVETPDFPSGYELPGIIAVTSSTRFGDWSNWSNYGATTVDLAAPGEGILAAAAGGGFKSVTGTSFSAPIVTGSVALLAAANPTATNVDLRSRILSSTVPAATLAGRTVTGGVLNANAAMFAIGSADGGGGLVADVAPSSPRPGARLGTPPVLAWTLPRGWETVSLRLSGAGSRFDRPLGAATRAVAHPTSAWRSGVYTWSIVARDGAGALHESAPRTYRMMPRLGAWVTSGQVRAGGQKVRLRIGYAASEPRATVKVRISVGSHTLHSGRATTRTTHVRGGGSPRRGWFGYDAKLSRSLRAGERITVEVRVSAGGATLVRRFRATVA